MYVSYIDVDIDSYIDIYIDPNLYDNRFTDGLRESSRALANC